MNIAPERLTEKAREALVEAQSISRRLSNQEVDVWHLLSALLNQKRGIVPSIIQKLGITDSAITLAVERELEKRPKVSGNVDTSKMYVTQSVNDVLTLAEDEEFVRGDDQTVGEILSRG